MGVARSCRSGFSLYDLGVVSEEQIQKWADEAEAGYDVDALTRRGRGRPGRGAEPMQVVAVRLTAEELDALDLDAGLDESVTVVEWGEGLAEVLSDDRLEVVIDRPHGASAGEEDLMDGSGVRRITVRGVGRRWAGVTLPA